MEFKIPPISVPENNPFEFDALDRKPSIEALTSLIGALKGPFVLAIDSPWGTGKTTLIRIWKAFLESQNYLCLYLNAWETDFTTDPLVAFLGELEALKKNAGTRRRAFNNQFNKAKKIATVLAKRALPAAGKIATAGLIDLDEFTEKALAEMSSDTIKDSVDAYLAEKDLIVRFRETLSKSITTLQSEGKKDQLVVFVDEIDRCRPSFAVNLLERIKHLFNIENAIFVLGLDKGQLAVSLKAIYGGGLRTDEYLRRFFDLEFALPKPNTAAFTKNLFDRFGFDAFFSQRSHSELRDDSSQLVKTFNSLSDIFQLSLRAREQCFTQIRVAMLTTASNQYLHPLPLVTLVMLKIGAPDVYRRYALESGSATDVTNYLRLLPGGDQLLNSHFGSVMEAHLISAKADGYEKPPEIEAYSKLINDESADQSTKERAKLVLSIVDNWHMRDRGPSFRYLINKIELAAKFTR